MAANPQTVRILAREFVDLTRRENRKLGRPLTAREAWARVRETMFGPQDSGSKIAQDIAAAQRLVASGSALAERISNLGPDEPLSAARGRLPFTGNTISVPVRITWRQRYPGKGSQWRTTSEDVHFTLPWDATGADIEESALEHLEEFAQKSGGIEVDMGSMTYQILNVAW